MLSSIGRAAIRRIGAGASHKSTNRVRQSILYVQRVRKAHNVGSDLTLRQFSSSLLRPYATTTPKTTSKKTTSTTKAKAIPQARKAVAKKAVKKAVKPKPKLKKKVAKKPKPKAKPKKRVLTPKQKERAERQKQTVALKSLKATALEPPKGKPTAVWNIIVQEATVGGDGVSTLTRLVKEAAAKYKSLTPTELEHYNHMANQNRSENEIAYKKFIDSHTPEEIRLANNARHQLAKRAGKKKSTKYSSLRDPRIPKPAARAWVLFCKERWSSGDFKGVKLPDATRLLFSEWKALSPSQRKPYEDQEAANKARYIQEYKTVFGREPQSVIRAAAA